MSSSGLFENLGYSSNQRFFMFYFICVPLRLSFPLILTIAEKKSNVKPVIALFGLMSVITNYRTLNTGTWWSRKNHLLSGLFLLLSTLYKNNNYSKIVLLLDVLYGLITSLIIKPF